MKPSDLLRCAEQIDDAPPDILQQMADRWCWHPKIIENARVGWDGGRIIVPSHDANGRIQADYAAFDPSSGRWSVTHPFLFPIAWLRDSEPVVLCESVVDALALQSLGVNSLVLAGQSLTYVDLPKLLSREVAIAPASRDAMAWAVRLADQLRRRADVRIVSTDGGPALFLSAYDDDHRLGAWQELVAGSQVHTASMAGVRRAAGLREAEGMIVSETNNEVVAQWTGHIIETGVDRNAGRSSKTRSFRLLLQHVDGSDLDVRWLYGQSLAEAVMEAEGSDGKWAISKKREDQVSLFMLRTSDSPREVMMGWSFGWNDDEFWTPQMRLTKDGYYPQGRMSFWPKNDWYGKVGMHPPTEVIQPRAAKLLTDELLLCHDCHVTMALFGIAVSAVLRRRLMPHQGRWNTIVIGPSAVGKTTRTRLFQRMFGAFDGDVDLLTWRSTSAALEDHLSGSGDLLAVIDDLNDHRMTTADFRKATDLLHSVTQGGGRRRFSDRNKPDPSPSQAQLVVTAEDFVSLDEAMMARALHVRIDSVDLMNGDYNRHWDRANAGTKELQSILPSIVLWHLTNDPDGARWQDVLEKAMEDAQSALDHARPGWELEANGLRYIARIGHTMAFARYGLLWAAEHGALPAFTHTQELDAMRNWASETTHAVTAKQQLGADLVDDISERLHRGVVHLDIVFRDEVIGTYPDNKPGTKVGVLQILEGRDQSLDTVQHRVNTEKEGAEQWWMTIWINDTGRQRKALNCPIGRSLMGVLRPAGLMRKIPRRRVADRSYLYALTKQAYRMIFPFMHRHRLLETVRSCMSLNGIS